jgi:hypothetical protein
MDLPAHWEPFCQPKADVVETLAASYGATLLLSEIEGRYTFEVYRNPDTGELWGVVVSPLGTACPVEVGQEP